MPIYRTYDNNFFKTWTFDMAYILGFMYADGNIVETKRGTYFISIYSADKDILQKIRKCFQSNHMISERISSTGSVYRIQIGSREWFNDLSKLGLFPNKTKRMILPFIPEYLIGDFVRGYFDGDGNVWSGLIHKSRVTPTQTIQVSFTSCSHLFLTSLREILQKNGIKGGGMYVPKRGNFSRLTLSSKDALIIYKIMYNAQHKLFLKRKKAVFDKFIANCGGKRNLASAALEKNTKT